MKVFIIEDEIDLASAIAKGLKKKGLIPEICHDGAEALEKIYINNYDIIILDLNLPSMDGIKILKNVRRTNKDLPILILSARSHIEQRIEGLDFGANDFLPKPFHFGELDARVRSLLRRSFVQNDTTLSFRALTLDTVAHTAMANESYIYFTPKEFSILEYLLLNIGKPLSTESIIEKIEKDDDALFSNSIKVHISTLRKKLTSSKCECNIFHIRGAGYLLKEEKYV